MATNDQIMAGINAILLAQRVKDFASAYENGSLMHECTARGDFRARTEITQKYISGAYKSDPSIPRYK